MDCIIDEWQNCYPSKWSGLIVKESMTHPAKFSSRLIRRIYMHMKEEGWLRIGDTVIDPFGGVALGALEAMRHGLHWVGVELEPKFVELGNQNIDEWNKRFSIMPKWGSAILLQGDSRKLLSSIQSANQSISSPPYADGSAHNGGDDPNPGKMQGGEYHGVGLFGSISSPPYNPPMSQEHNGSRGGKRGTTPSEPGAFVKYGTTQGQLEGMSMDGFELSISSPPFRHSEGGTPEPKEGGVIDKSLQARHAAGNSAANGYGNTDGNLANFAEGDFHSSISSPPFGEALTGGGIAKKGYQNDQLRKGSEETPFDLVGKRSYMPSNQGETPGQLASMPADDFKAAVSSPPYERSLATDLLDKDERIETARKNGINNAEFISPIDMEKLGMRHQTDYGNTEGQLGAEAAETFWTAARTIVDQVYLALMPGGHAVWVVKDYIKNKQRVPFSDQWRQLCETVGFITLHEHHATLVHAKQQHMDGHIVNKESKSFFRRLAEKKGSPRIDYETVFCMIKPS